MAKQPLNVSNIATKYKLHHKLVGEILADVKPLMQVKYGRGFMRYYDADAAKAAIDQWREEQEKARQAKTPPPEAAIPVVQLPQDQLSVKVDNLALGMDLMIEKLDALSAQNALLLKAIEKLQAPAPIVEKLPVIENGALDKFLTSLPSAQGNGAKPAAPEPAKPRKPRVMIVGLPPASVSTISKEFADLDITFHSAERAKKLANATARGYDRVLLMLDQLNWGLPILGADVKRVDVKGGVSSLKTALTAAFLELTDA